MINPEINNEPESRDMEPENTSRNRRFSLRNIKTFESFKVPAYRILFLSHIGQWSAMSMQMMVRSLLVYRLTGSGTMIGMMALVQVVPQLLMSLFAGALADRVQKRSILIVAQLVPGVITFCLAVSLASGYLNADDPSSWWVLFMTAIGQGTVMGMMMPVRIAIIPEIVGEERVMNAVSLTTVGQTAFMLAGPTLAGFLINNYDFSVVYFVMTGTYALSAFFTFLLPRTRKISPKGESNTFKEVIEGFRYVRKETVFLLIVIFGMCHMISGMPYMQLTAVFTEDVLQVGEIGLGVLMTVSGVGAAISSLIIASLPNRKRGILLLFSGIVMSVPLIVFSFSSWYGLSLAMMPFIGMGPVMHGALTGALIQNYADPGYRGRVQSLTAIGASVASFGTFIAGILVDAVGVQWAVGSMAIFLSAVSIGFYIFFPSLRKLE
ncbi:MAG: MFS transporter [Dehalococcoidales bacterium]|nr:MAG: MFS transporter [Dehalococcoidales bacterium]